MKNKKYSNYGTFKVITTDYFTIKELGVYTGYIDEIAFALADKNLGTLEFKLIDTKSLDLTPRQNTVRISLSEDSEVYDLNNEDTLNYFKELFSDRDVEIVDAQSHGFCIIKTHKETIKEKREKILNKLSDEEKAILGLSDMLFTKEDSVESGESIQDLE